MLKAALAQELVAQQRRLVVIQSKLSDEVAESKKLLHILHGLRMLFVSDVEKLAAEASKLESQATSGTHSID